MPLCLFSTHESSCCCMPWNCVVSPNEQWSERRFEICSTLTLCWCNKQQWPQSKFAWRTAVTYEALWSVGGPTTKWSMQTLPASRAACSVHHCPCRLTEVAAYTCPGPTFHCFVSVSCTALIATKVVMLCLLVCDQ